MMGVGNREGIRRVGNRLRGKFFERMRYSVGIIIILSYFFEVVESKSTEMRDVWGVKVLAGRDGSSKNLIFSIKKSKRIARRRNKN